MPRGTPAIVNERRPCGSVLHWTAVQQHKVSCGSHVIVMYDLALMKIRHLTGAETGAFRGALNVLVVHSHAMKSVYHHLSGLLLSHLHFPPLLLVLFPQTLFYLVWVQGPSRA